MSLWWHLVWEWRLCRLVKAHVLFSCVCGTPIRQLTFELFFDSSLTSLVVFSLYPLSLSISLALILILSLSLSLSLFPSHEIGHIRWRDKHRPFDWDGLDRCARAKAEGQGWRWWRLSQSSGASLWSIYDFFQHFRQLGLSGCSSFELLLDKGHHRVQGGRLRRVCFALHVLRVKQFQMSTAPCLYY